MWDIWHIYFAEKKYKINEQLFCLSDNTFFIIATRWGLDVSEFEVRLGGRRFSLFHTLPGRPCYRLSLPDPSPGVKLQGRRFEHPPHLMSRLKKIRALQRLHLCAYVPWYRRIFTFKTIFIFLRSIKRGFFSLSGAFLMFSLQTQSIKC